MVTGSEMFNGALPSAHLTKLSSVDPKMVKSSSGETKSLVKINSRNLKLKLVKALSGESAGLLLVTYSLFLVLETILKI